MPGCLFDLGYDRMDIETLYNMHYVNNLKEVVVENKFVMSVEENTLVVKKLLADKIILSPKDSIKGGVCDIELVDCNMEFIQTDLIKARMESKGYKYADYLYVINYRDTWGFIFDTIEDEITLEYWNHVNGLLLQRLDGEHTPSGTLRLGFSFNSLTC